MRTSTWILLALLTALTAHCPWLIEGTVTGVAWAAQQPALLALAAIATAIYKLQHRNSAAVATAVRSKEGPR
jgi:hypothetical protein